jgi:acetyltransferase EpsM
MKSVIIVSAGSGSHARVLFDACVEAGRAIAGWIRSADNVRPPADDLELIGGNEMLEVRNLLARHEIALGVGDQAARRSLAEQVVGNGGSLATIIHPSSIVSRSATIGSGTALLAASVVGVGAHVGRFCIVNTGATVDHDCELSDGVNLCPGVHLSGSIRCGQDAFIGTGASVLPGVRIGARAVVGAGAVVVADVSDEQTVVGVPARPIFRAT